MKNVHQAYHFKTKYFLILFFILLFTYGLNAQVIVVNYMKVKDGKFSEYLEIEKQWTRLHQLNKDEGNITGWALYRKMFGGTSNEYDYITADAYPDWKTFDTPWSEEIVQFINDSIGEEVMNQTTEIRDLVRSEVYKNRLLADNSKPGNVYNLVFVKVEEKNIRKYIELIEKYYKPMAEKLIDKGVFNFWGLYERINPLGGDFNFLADFGYENMGQLDKATDDVFEETWMEVATQMGFSTPREFHEQRNMETYVLRELVHSEYWRLIMDLE
jgi:hypothetical protein